MSLIDIHNVSSSVLFNNLRKDFYEYKIDLDELNCSHCSNKINIKIQSAYISNTNFNSDKNNVYILCDGCYTFNFIDKILKKQTIADYYRMKRNLNNRNNIIYSRNNLVCNICYNILNDNYDNNYYNFNNEVISCLTCCSKIKELYFINYNPDMCYSNNNNNVISDEIYHHLFLNNNKQLCYCTQTYTFHIPYKLRSRANFKFLNRYDGFISSIINAPFINLSEWCMIDNKTKLLPNDDRLCGFLVKCKFNDYQIASYLIDNTGDIYINVIYNDIDKFLREEYEYYSSCFNVETYEDSYKLLAKNKLDITSKELLLSLSTSFASYIRLNLELDILF